MTLANWLRSVFGRPVPSCRRPGQRRPTPRPTSHPLHLEVLEDRTLLSVLPFTGFDGIDSHTNVLPPLVPGSFSIVGVSPPDAIGAAGPSSFVETVNISLAIYSKTTGAQLAPITSFASFFNLPDTGHFTDPVAIYNELTGRFGVGIVNEEDNHFEFAISKTSNPQTLGPADWMRASFNTNDGSSSFPDFPKIGYNADGFVVSFNMYFGTSSLHVSTLSIKNDLTSPGIQVVPGLTHFTLAPATMHGASPSDPMWFVEEDDPFGGAGYGHNAIVVQMINPFSSLPGWVFTPVSVVPYGVTPRSALQPGGSLDSVDTRFDFSALRTVGGTTHLVTAHLVGDAAGVDRVRWYDFSVGGATPSLIQEGEINQGTDVDTFLPTVDMAPDGSIGMTFSQSSATAPSGYLSMYVTGRAATDPAGTMQTPVLVKQGTATINIVTPDVARVGDYSFTCIDPSDGSFWSANEYGGFGGDFNWSTWIEHFQVNTQPTATTAGNPLISSCVYGQTVLVFANVTSGSAPVTSGTVTFKEGSTVLVSQLPLGFGGTAIQSPILPAGTHTITAEYNGGPGFLPSSGSFTLTVTPAPLTVTANNATRAYSQTNPAFTAGYSGFVNSETASVLSGSPSLTTSATAGSAPNTYPIIAGLGTLAAANYQLTFVNGTLTVTPAMLTASGVNVSATAGAPFSGPVANFANADPFGSAASYSAVITWGDGSTSAGVLSGSGTLTVSGAHTYADPVNETVQVTISHQLGYTTTATTTATATVTSLGQGVQDNQTATVAFWHHDRGQDLITRFNGGPSATGLANWLALSFPNLYGANAGSQNLFGQTNTQVAAFFQGLWSAHHDDPAVQVLAMALNVYATTAALGGAQGAGYGFRVTAAGLGASSFNVRQDGTAFGVANGTTLNVYELLRAVDQRAVNGVLYNGDAHLGDLCEDLFERLNGTGD